MGLTIHYTLTARGSLPDETVRQLVQRTARRAKELGCAHVGKVLSSLESDREAPDFFDTRWGNPRRCSGGSGTRGWLVEVWPGEGCATAVFGLMRRRPRDPGVWPRCRRTRRDACWELHEYCKTYYAALVSHDHFVRCHERVIRLLDLWRRAGVTVRVQDEGGFWKSRSREALAAQIGDLEAFRKMAGSGIWE